MYHMRKSSVDTGGWVYWSSFSEGLKHYYPPRKVSGSGSGMPAISQSPEGRCLTPKTFTASLTKTRLAWMIREVMTCCWECTCLIESRRLETGDGLDFNIDSDSRRSRMLFSAIRFRPRGDQRQDVVKTQIRSSHAEIAAWRSEIVIFIWWHLASLDATSDLSSLQALSPRSALSFVSFSVPVRSFCECCLMVDNRACRFCNSSLCRVILNILVLPVEGYSRTLLADRLGNIRLSDWPDNNCSWLGRCPAFWRAG